MQQFGDDSDEQYDTSILLTTCPVTGRLCLSTPWGCSYSGIYRNEVQIFLFQHPWFSQMTRISRECISNTYNNPDWAIVKIHAIRTRVAQTDFMVNVCVRIVGVSSSRHTYCLITWKVQTTWYSWNNYWTYWITLSFLLRRVLLCGTSVAHFSLSIRSNLNEIFGQRWISRGVPVILMGQLVFFPVRVHRV